jgi:TolA-binding protein
MKSTYQCRIGAVALSVLAQVLALGANAWAQTPVPVGVPATAPPPAIAQTQETLSARTLVRLEQLSRELTETIGRVETLEGAVAAQKAENERLITLLDMVRAHNVNAQPAGDLSAKASSAITQEMAAPVVTAPATAMFTPPTPPALTPAIMLTNAQTALQSGSYPIAEANLSQLIWVYPASPEASEGRWLLGEARFVQASWGTAAQAYVDYLKVSPQGPRASEALVRLAGAFRQLGDNRQRCVALAEFKRRTPRPDPTLKARADGEIARMTCPPA